MRVANTGAVQGMQVDWASSMGQLAEGDKWAPLKGKLHRMYLWSISEPIGGGTSIPRPSKSTDRNCIIATRGLGLPRGT